MLDFSVLSQKMGQGRSTAEMTLAAARATDAPSPPAAPGPAGPSTVEAGSSRPGVDPRLVAREVYRLMRQELAIRHQRRGAV
jgi:hypothetical protein